MRIANCLPPRTNWRRRERTLPGPLWVPTGRLAVDGEDVAQRQWPPPRSNHRSVRRLCPSASANPRMASMSTGDNFVRALVRNAALLGALSLVMVNISACGSQQTAEDPRTVTPLVAVAEVEQ